MNLLESLCKIVEFIYNFVDISRSVVPVVGAWGWLKGGGRGGSAIGVTKVDYKQSQNCLFFS